MRIVLAFVVGQSAKFCIVAESLEMTVYENVSMILFRVTNPHESTIAGDGTVVEERWTTPQYRVTATIDTAVHPITTAIGLQGIAVANDVNVLEVVAFAVYQQSLCLTLAIGLDSQIAKYQVTAIIGSKGGTT